MKRFLLSLMLAFVPSFAIAADKGEPPQRIDAQGFVKPLFQGCYVDAAGQSWFVNNADNMKGLTLGAGCDRQTGRIVYGGKFSYSLMEAGERALSITPRLGMALNSHTLAYGKLDYTVDGKTFKLDSGFLSVGGGLETYLTKNITIYVEGSQSLKGFGDNRDMPTVYTIQTGLKWRF